MRNRGSIPRRRPNPDRARPKPTIQVVATPMYHAPGPVTVPGNGSVKIFEHRFPVDGAVRDASLHIPDIPAGANIQCQIRVDGELARDGDAGDFVAAREPIRVGANQILTAHIVQADGEAPMTITPNIAYTFQEFSRAEAATDI